MSKLVGGLCAALGVLLLVGGFGAYFYEVQYRQMGLWLVVEYPYRDLAIPLMALGVILIIAGAFLYAYAQKETAPPFGQTT